MNNVFHIGATGLRAQQSAVDAVANNVANVNTPAYKRNAVAFAEMVGSAAAGADGMGVTVAASPKVLEQGDLRKTDGAFDLAVRGAGFIELMAPGGQTLLWRGGTLRVNADGLLASAGGMALKAGVSVPRETTALSIAPGGQVLATVAGQKEPQPIGQIDLVAVADARALTALGDGLYRLDDPLAETARGAPGDGGVGLLAQGHLEASNVRMADEMVGMLMMQRAYAANARMLQVADEMMATINQLRR